MDNNDIESYKYEIIKEINKYRNNHRAKPLTSDPNIDKIAQDFADKLSRMEKLDYSYNKYRGRDLGESVYESNGYIAPFKLIKTFYDEYIGYNYNDRNPEPSNFTQMVWQNSKLIGFGMQKASNYKYYIVINYYPSGNVEGLFKQNVLPSGTGTNFSEETKTRFETSSNKREPSLKTIYKKRDISNGRSHVEITIKNSNDKKVAFHKRDDKSPIYFKRYNDTKPNTSKNNYDESDESFFNKIYSRKTSFANKDEVNQNSSTKNAKNNNFNNYKKAAISAININNIYNNHKTSAIREYIRKTLKKVNMINSTKDNISSETNRSNIRKSTKKDARTSINRDKIREKIRESIKKGLLRKYLTKDKNRKSINKNLIRKSINKKDFSMNHSANKSFVTKPIINKIYQKRDTKHYYNNNNYNKNYNNNNNYNNNYNNNNHNYKKITVVTPIKDGHRYDNNNNNLALNRDYKKKQSFLNKNNQKSSAININYTKNDPLFDISNYKHSNQNASQTGSNFYQRKPTKRLDIAKLLAEKKNLNNNFIQKKEPENQNRDRKSMKREPNNNGKRSNYTNTHHSAPKYESTSPEYDNFCNEALLAHNNYRKIHHVGPLKLNRELCKIAQNYANHLANVGRLQHSDNVYHNDAMGENLYYCFGKDPTGSSVTASWYSEIKSYNYSGDWSNGTGHFTQIVWKETEEVGFGKYKDQSGKTFVVANYYPAGNVLGFFKYNVLRP